MDFAELDRSAESLVGAGALRVWRRKIVFLLVSAMVFAPLTVAILAIQPTYEGSTLLISGQSEIEAAADRTRNPAETTVALSRIAESEEVVSDAIANVGLDNIVPQGTAPNASSVFDRLRRAVFPAKAEPERPVSRLEAFLPRIKLALSVKSETNSNVLQISFRHHDPSIAARFANAVAQAFVDRQLALYSRPEAEQFFQFQQQRFEGDVKGAGDALEQFANRTGTYAATDQKQLLLKQVTDLDGALAETRGSIADKMAQRQVLSDELRKLAPVAHSPYMSSLVESLGTTGRPIDTHVADDHVLDSQLLLVPVYQASVASLFKLNADLAGAQSLQKQQTEQMARLTSQLSALAANEQEYARLSRAIDRANYNADTYGRRAVEERIAADSTAARLSSVKVLQRATVPLRPASPSYPGFFAAAAFVAAMVAFGVTLLLPTRRRRAAT